MDTETLVNVIGKHVEAVLIARGYHISHIVHNCDNTYQGYFNTTNSHPYVLAISVEHNKIGMRCWSSGHYARTIQQIWAITDPNCLDDLTAAVIGYAENFKANCE